MKLILSLFLSFSSPSSYAHDQNSKRGKTKPVPLLRIGPDSLVDASRGYNLRNALEQARAQSQISIRGKSCAQLIDLKLATFENPLRAERVAPLTEDESPPMEALEIPSTTEDKTDVDILTWNLGGSDWHNYNFKQDISNHAVAKVVGVQAIQQTLLQQKPRVVLFQEMASKAMLNDISNEEISKNYDVFNLADEHPLSVLNRNFGQFQAVLIRKSNHWSSRVWKLPDANFSLKSDELLGPELVKPVFFHGVNVIELYQNMSDKPTLIVINTHLKSVKGAPITLKYRSQNLMSAIGWRMTQISFLAETVHHLRKLFPGIPILLGGDFNADLDGDVTLRVFESQMQDAAHVSQKNRKMNSLNTLARSVYVQDPTKEAQKPQDSSFPKFHRVDGFLVPFPISNYPVQVQDLYVPKIKWGGARMSKRPILQHQPVVMKLSVQPRD